MNNTIFLIYPALLIYLFAGAKIYKKGTWNEEVMSLNQMKALQGFMVVIVMFHHLSQKVSASWINPIYYKPGMNFFVDIGYLCVSVFLFCSGYGLYISVTKKPDYLAGFFKKRVLPIIITFYISEIIYFLVRVALREKMDMRLTLEFLSGIRQTNPNAWYSIALPLFYVFFYFAFKYAKTSGKAIFIVWICILCYTLLGTCIDHNDYLMCGEWWYNSAHLFPIGMLFAKYQDRILDVMKRHYGLYVSLCFVLAIVFFFLGIIATNIFSYYYGEGWPLNATLWDSVWRRWVCLSMQVICSTLVVLFTVLLRMKIQIGNRALSYIGGMTLEFYLMHGLFVHIFSWSFANVGPVLYYIKNPSLYVIVVTILSVITCAPYKKLNKWVVGLLTH